MNYLADWIRISVEAHNKLKGQTVVTGDSFGVRVSVEDNI